uniref:RING-type domain-containing protein n=1 Tax=Bubo bubo TaxID=30461 RepID=A0A8C0FP47_BUBBB
VAAQDWGHPMTRQHQRAAAPAVTPGKKAPPSSSGTNPCSQQLQRGSSPGASCAGQVCGLWLSSSHILRPARRRGAGWGGPEADKCFVCGKNGAAITCCQEGCDRSFHLPCAMEGECITQYFAPHRSFCREHRPEQQVEAALEKNTDCLICMEPVEDRKSYHTMVCPACKHAWFHRGCIQARYAGISFNCPVCRDQHDFLLDMLTMGIRIPLRLVSCLRHSRCDARVCLCPGGREQAEEEGPWELLLCSSCGAEGTHRRCSNLRTRRTSWECESCAGQGTGKRQSTFMALGWGQGPGKAWQEVPRLGLAEPLCSRRSVATSLASPQ